MSKCFPMLWLTLLFLGCQQEPESLPALSEGKLIEILTDIHIVEAGLQGNNQDVKDSIARVQYLQLFQLHDVNDKDFYNSFDFYAQYPTTMEEIYDKVAINIQSKELK